MVFFPCWWSFPYLKKDLSSRGGFFRFYSNLRKGFAEAFDFPQSNLSLPVQIFLDRFSLSGGAPTFIIPNGVLHLNIRSSHFAHLVFETLLASD